MANETKTPRSKESCPSEVPKDSPAECVIDGGVGHVSENGASYTIALNLTFTPRQKDGKHLCVLSEDALVTEIENMMHSLDSSLEFIWKEQLEADEFDRIHNTFPEGCSKDPSACETCQIDCSIVPKWRLNVEEHTNLQRGRIAVALETTPYFAENIHKLKEQSRFQTYGEYILDLLRFQIAEMAESLPFYPVKVDTEYLPTLNAASAYHGLLPKQFLTRLVTENLREMKLDLGNTFLFVTSSLGDD